MTVPIATSPGRGGFGPDLSLSYDSGAGNGIFGFGWRLSTPAILRKVDKGVPQYDDSRESDVFLLSGFEDLVPVLGTTGKPLEDTASAPGYLIRRYRPRVEGAFTRIERWSSVDGDVHWRSLTRDNVLNVYGVDLASRVTDPEDASRTFSWLLSETRDDRGNVVAYEYLADNGDGVDLGQAHQRNRGEPDDRRRTAVRYIQRIRYGNRIPLLDDSGGRPHHLTAAELDGADWMFELVFDYDEGRLSEPTFDVEGRATVTASAVPTRSWAHRRDAFSSYRSGFEVRTTRLCHRILMFHHFESDPEVGRDCLVGSTELTYRQPPAPAAAPSPSYAFLQAVTHRGYRRSGAGYELRELPPVEFSYTPAVVHSEVQDVQGTGGGEPPSGQEFAAQLVDLYGEGLTGILAERSGAWYYRSNLSPMTDGCVFAEPELVATKPIIGLATAKLMDLAGDGRPDLVDFDGPVPGFYELAERGRWRPLRPFSSRLNRSVADPRLRFADLDGDGRSDILVTEESALVWYRSLGEEGYESAVSRPRPIDEETGPDVDLSSAEAVFLADMTGDGLSDLVRVRNGAVCFWPSLGRGRFGPKVVMDGGPWFDSPDLFDPKRVRLGDVDGTGTTDLVYLRDDGVHLFFNESGNAWSPGVRISGVPTGNPFELVDLRDLLGDGTACLVWSSSAPGDWGRPLRYLALMGSEKPHLLAGVVNNLGVECTIHYAPSTRFYLADKAAGEPWVCPLPFPVHVVARVETRDLVGGSELVTRYAYHHGYFDGEEREYRGFGMVEQWDSEVIEALGPGDRPAVRTRTWFHTGIDAGRGGRAASYINQYYQGASMLAESILPAGLSSDEEREAWRALRGAMVRQEVYADDIGAGATEDQVTRAATPYSVSEARYEVRMLQPRGRGPFRHAAFFTHGSEAVTAIYERAQDEPRVRHSLTLEVDVFGNTLSEAVVAYGRRTPDPSLTAADAARQGTTWVTLSQHAVTNPVDTPGTFRTPMPCEISSYQLTGFVPTDAGGRYRHADLLVAADEIAFHATPGSNPCRRVLNRTRSLYRADDLDSLLTLGRVESRALMGEEYGLAFGDDFVDQVFRRPRAAQNDELLLPDHTALTTEGGYVSSRMLKADGRFPPEDAIDGWWIPGGRSFLSADPDDSAAAELAEARSRFFKYRRYRDPFGQDTVVEFDDDDLLLTATQDALGNRIVVDRNDYRVLQPRLVSDPNGNQVEVAYDALGLVVGRAAMGKPAPAPVEGDSLAGFIADLTPREPNAFLADPGTGQTLLGAASSRIVYDLDLFRRSRSSNPEDPAAWQPAFSATLSRETHVADAAAPDAVRVQIGFTYSDGWGRVVQRKTPAAAGPVSDGGPTVEPRWVGSGWTIFDNKANRVREYEPFFSATHAFERNVIRGVSAIRLYDPPGRVVATVHPNHTYDKAVFDAWRQTSYDATDTCAPRNRETGDPRTDLDVAGFVGTVLADPAWRPWHAERVDGALGADEATAARRAAVHADTPAIEHLDSLGRTFLSLRINRVVCTGHDDDNTEAMLTSRTDYDIEGRELVVMDGGRKSGGQHGRLLAGYTYDMAGNRVRQLGLDAGSRWLLTDVSGKPIRAWDDRGHDLATTYDALRRPVAQTVHGTSAESDPRTRAAPVVIGRIEYGEGVPAAETMNLRTRAFREFDSSGIAVNARLNAAGRPTAAYDFKGNLLFSTRQILDDYRGLADWDGSPALGPEAFETATLFDALDRPVHTVLPHLLEARTTVMQSVYDAGNQISAVDVWLDRVGPSVGIIDAAIDAPSPVGVVSRDYDAKGRCTATLLANGLRTEYRYDPLSQRLARLMTDGVQDLTYTYDPVGNIIHTHDATQQATFFLNRRAEPDGDFVYDSINRLVEARGREHLGQQGPTPHSHSDAFRTGLGSDVGGFAPGDGAAMGSYVERYSYDLAGNLLRMKHLGADPANPGWRRDYDYLEASLAEGTERGNRLTRSTLHPNQAQPSVEPLQYDRHGNVVVMSHLGVGEQGTNLDWDHRDQLRRSDRGGGDTFYVYDSGGRRVRKVWEKAPGLVEERIYIGAFELFRRHRGPMGPARTTFVRETIHVTVGEQRLALVETRRLDTLGNDPAPALLIRYQLANNVHSSALEVDELSRIISYEEYSPFGSTTYQAVRSQTEAPKRFRYTGCERDEETGLYYNGARYLAVWLGRWTAPDPLGLKSGPNCYTYCSNSPVRFLDPLGMDEWCGLSDGFFGMFSSECHIEPHIAGGIKTVGGALETVGGAAMVVGGAATCEVGVGCFVFAAGLGVTAHGLDTTQSGFRSALRGEQVDSFTSEGLQSVGVSRRSANLVDAGISVVGSLGASAVTRAPAAAGALAEGAEAAPSITVALRPALGPGHNYVGVTTADGITTWSHLAVRGATGPSGASVVTGGEAVVEGLSGAQMVSRLSSSISTRVPVSATQADAALKVVNNSIQATEAAGGTFGAYSLTSNSCSTYAASVLNAGGVSTPALTSPTINLLSSAVRSPTVVSAVSTSGTAVNTVTFATNAREATMAPTTPSAFGGTSTSPSTGMPNAADYGNYDDFRAAVPLPYTNEFVMQQWANVHGWRSQ